MLTIDDFDGYKLTYSMTIKPVLIEGKWYIETAEGVDGFAPRAFYRYGPMPHSKIESVVADIRATREGELKATMKLIGAVADGVAGTGGRDGN